MFASEQRLKWNEMMGGREHGVALPGRPSQGSRRSSWKRAWGEEAGPGRRAWSLTATGGSREGSIMLTARGGQSSFGTWQAGAEAGYLGEEVVMGRVESQRLD